MDPIDTSMLTYQALNSRNDIPSIKGSDGTPEGDAKLKQACEDFEAMFLKMMLDSMRKTVNKSELIDEGMSGDIFEDLLYDEYSKVMAKTGSFGIADMLYSQLSTESVQTKKAVYQ